MGRGKVEPLTDENSATGDRTMTEKGKEEGCQEKKGSQTEDTLFLSIV